MTEEQVVALLRGGGDSLRVGPAPVSLMVRRVGRQRRRRRGWTVFGAGVAVASLTVAFAVGASVRGKGDPAAHRTPSSPSTSGSDRLATQAKGAGLDCTRLLSIVSAENAGGDLVDFDATCRPRPTLSGGHSDAQPALSPDGQQIAVVRNGVQLVLIDRGTGAAHTLDSSANGLGDPTFSPDGESVAYWCEDNGRPGLCTVDISTGAIGRFAVGSEASRSPAWNWNGALLAFQQGTRLAILRVSTGHVRPVAGSTGLRHPFWGTGDEKALLLAAARASADSTRIVYANGRHTRSRPIPGAFTSVTYDDWGIHVSTSESQTSSTVTQLDFSLRLLGRLALPGEVYLAPHPVTATPSGTTPDGRTWGSGSDNPTPDLVAAQTTDGHIGYVADADMNGPSPRNPTQALTWQRNVPGSRVAAYATDGLTIMGVFDVGEPGGNDPLTYVAAPPNATTETLNGTLHLNGACTYLQDSAGKHLLLLPWGEHLGQVGNTTATQLLDRAGRSGPTNGAYVTVTAADVGGQAAAGICTDELSPSYVTSFK